MDPSKVRDIVESCDRMYAKYAEKYAQNCYSMKYEEFKGNPVAFEGLYDFLGEEFSLSKVAQILNIELEHCKEQ